MSRRLLRFGMVLAIATVVGASAYAATKPAKHSLLRNTSANADVPLAVFQRVDKQLTILDADSQAVRLKRKHINEIRGPARRTRALRQVQQSPQSIERMRAVNQLLTISSIAERTYRARHQRYGARLFRDLHTKAAALRKPILRSQAAPTPAAFDRDEKVVDARLLSVVRQFQNISGGYAALACRPGSWACCKPKVTRDGKLEVRGCNWSCASSLTACSGGCLGPRIPNTVVAVKNGVPKLHDNSQHTMLARNHTPRKAKSPARGTVAASRQSTTIGND